LEKDAPLRRAIQRCGAIITTPILFGLHHRECSPLDSVANRHEMILPKWGTIFSRHGRGVNSNGKNSSGKNDGCLSKAVPVRIEFSQIGRSRNE
jgi:hypothetical protein